jgi:hypothetical protein
MTSEEVCIAAEITYRQLHHWATCGWLRPDRHANNKRGKEGSGVPWDWPDQECRVARRMGQLVRGGVRASAAAGIARTWVATYSVDMEASE